MKRFLKRRARPFPPTFLLGLLAFVLLIMAGWLAYQRLTRVTITDFNSCVKAGNPILESYPEQCVHNGQSFINPSQNIPKPY